VGKFLPKLSCSIKHFSNAPTLENNFSSYKISVHRVLYLLYRDANPILLMYDPSLVVVVVAEMEIK
jgi:hypothetical protein